MLRLCVAAIVLASTTALADNIFWDGSANQSFNADQNWTNMNGPNRSPGPGDNARFVLSGTPGPISVNLNSGQFVNALRFQNTSNSITLNDGSNGLQFIQVGQGGIAIFPTFTGGTVTINPAISVQDGQDQTWDIQGANQTLRITREVNLSGRNVQIAGAGDVVIDGTVHGIPGQLIMNGTGKLRLNGSIFGPVTVNTRGTLGGTGTINGTVSGLGRVAPGNSPGILMIDGDYTQSSTSTLEIEVASYSGTVGSPAWVPGTDHDQLQVTGTATLGGRLEIPIIDPLKAAGGPTIGLPPIDFLTAGSVVGKFSAVVAPGLNQNLAVDVEYIPAGPNQGARLSFVPIKTNIVFDEEMDTTANWFNSDSTWENALNPGAPALPTLVHDISIENLTANAQEVEIEDNNAFVAKLTVGGGSQDLTVQIGNGTPSPTTGNLSSTLDVTVEENGVIALNAGTLATSEVTLINGGMLTGNGLVDLASESAANRGTLTVTSGTISPGLSIGHLDIDGDLNLTTGGGMVFEATSETIRDTLAITGDAILEGSLTLNITGSSIQSGNRIQLLTAESIDENFSSFDVIGNDDLFFVLSTEEIAGGLFALNVDPFMLGDMNRSGGLPDVDDVAAFALALTDPNRYQRGPLSDPNFPNGYGISAAEAGNIDHTGQDCDVDDIDDFARILNMSLSELTARIQLLSVTVPEPGSSALLGSFFCTLLGTTRIRASSS